MFESSTQLHRLCVAKFQVQAEIWHTRRLKIRCPQLVQAVDETAGKEIEEGVPPEPEPTPADEDLSMD